LLGGREKRRQQLVEADKRPAHADGGCNALVHIVSLARKQERLRRRRFRTVRDRD
jgi:hypothetical protein